MRMLALLAIAACWSKPILPPNDHLDDPVHLAAGQKHACAISSDGTLWCWGNNSNSQLGDSPVAMTGTPVIAVPGTWDWVAAGDRHTCAINTAHELFCWGDDSARQVGHLLEPNAPPTKMALPGGATPAKVFAGSMTTCAIDDAGLLYCWGVVDIDHVSIEVKQIEPGNVAGPWRSVAIGPEHACALRDDDNQLYCWGKDDSGQLGVDNDRAIDHASPRDREFVSAAAGPFATCAITVDRELVCFGSNANGLIGTSPESTKDVVVDAKRRWTAVALGVDHTCAVGDGGVFCFGDNDRGALGDDFEPRAELPSVEVIGAVRVVAGDGFGCSSDDVGRVSCWGANAYGELGNHEVATQRHPVRIPLTKNVARLTVGQGHTCALFNDFTADCWGDNRAHQVNPTAGYVVVPTPYPSLQFTDISAGGKHTCGIDALGSSLIHCWGSNGSRQLGSANGEVTSASIGATLAWNQVSAGSTTTCAVALDGKLGCWGDLPDSTPGASPMAAVDTSYTAVAVGRGFAIAALRDKNANQDNLVQIGKSDDCNATRPFPNAGDTLAGHLNDSWQLAASQDDGHACALDYYSQTGPVVDLYCWGANTAGQLAISPAACATPVTPIPAPATMTWALSGGNHIVTVGAGHSCAINNVHDIYCWGANDHGELADLPSGHLPRKIIATTGFSSVVTGPNHTCAIDDVSGLWCWGENRFGELGNGQRFHPEPHAVDLP